MVDPTGSSGVMLAKQGMHASLVKGVLKIRPASGVGKEIEIRDTRISDMSDPYDPKMNYGGVILYAGGTVLQDKVKPGTVLLMNAKDVGPGGSK